MIDRKSRSRETLVDDTLRVVDALRSEDFKTVDALAAELGLAARTVRRIVEVVAKRWPLQRRQEPAEAGRLPLAYRLPPEAAR